MATFKPTTRTNKEYNAVYIRIIHKSKVDYIRTDMMLHKSGIRKGEISDYSILGSCALIIKEYNERLNQINNSKMTVKEIKEFLTTDRNSISFTNFANKFISQMFRDGRIKPSENFQTAVNSLYNFLGKKEVAFSDITSQVVRDWIKSLQGTARAKQMYPMAVKAIFNAGCNEYNDYDRDIIRIKNQPFRTIKIPRADQPRKRFAEIDTLRKIFAIEPRTEREELAHNVVNLVLCLAGINAIDLYNIEKEEFKNGKFCYNRTKEETVRIDRAYFEITVPKRILSILEKHKGKKRVFNFSERYSTSDNFTRAINTGLKSLCERADVKKITVYFLRHAWATIARNECRFSEADVAFGLNHASAHKVTEMYIEKDFSLVDRINEKVIGKVFYQP